MSIRHYKHREVLGNHTFVYDLEGLYCVWQNAYCAKDTSVEILLDFFEEKADGSYTAMGSSSQSVHTAMKSFALLRRRQGSRLPAIMKR